MRLPEPKAPVPTNFVFDVVISQTVGFAATGMTVRNQPTGGSEWQVVVLAEALAALGYSVGVCSPVTLFTVCNGVTYIPHLEMIGRTGPFGEQRPTAHVRCDVLISERFGQLPDNIEFKRVVFDLHDLPDDRLGVVVQMMRDIPDSKLVVHSEHMRYLMPDFPRLSVIPCMIPDQLYEPMAPTKRPDKHYRYVYGSSALKGLEPTLAFWRALKKDRVYHFRKAHLTLTSPGYDTIKPELLKNLPDVSVVTGLAPGDMQLLLNNSDGIFMVSNYAESFGIVFHQCEIAGKPARVLQLDGDDALATTLANDTRFKSPQSFIDSFSNPIEMKPAHDFRVSTYIQSWIDVLDLKKETNGSNEAAA